MARSYAYCYVAPRAKRTTCPHCGGKMSRMTSDPRDQKLLCPDRACNDEQIRKAGGCELSPYDSARERGHCL